MTNGNNDVRELEDLLTELEGQGALPVGHYAEEDDAVTQLMDAPLGEQEWMVQITPHDRRMMSTEQLLSELATGNLVTPDLLVWRSGMGDWAAISTMPELRVGRAVMDAVPERRPLPAPPPPPAPIPPRINSNGIGSSTLASPSPIGRAPLPPPPSVPFVPQPPAPHVDLSPVSSLPVFGAAAPAPSPEPELNPFSPPAAIGSTTSPALGSASRGSAPGSIPAPAPATARVNTHGPVAVDFSEMEPPRSGVTRVLVGSAIAAMLMIGGTVYGLSAGGVFQATPQVSSEVASSKPAAAAAAAEPAMAPMPKPAEPEPEPKPAEAPAAAGSTEPQTQPASVKEMQAEPAASEPPKRAADDEGAKASAEAKSEETPSEEEASSAPSPAKARKAAARRNRREKAEEKAASAEREKPEPRRAPERRVKARAAATAAPEVAKAEVAEEAPKSADAPGSTFNKQAAKSALDGAAEQARNCRPAGGPSGAGKVQVRYEPNGKVGAVTLLTPSFENTTTGDCVVMVFRRAAIPAFTGAPAVVMNKNFEIP
jgi:hypothetical protein